MEFFTNPFQGLVVADTKEDEKIKVIGEYSNFKNDFSKAFNGFKQHDYVQIPHKLIPVLQIHDKKFEFVSTLKSPSPSAQSTSKPKNDQQARVPAFDDRSLSMVDSDDSNSMNTLQSSNRSSEVNRVQKDSSLMAFNDLQSVATSNTNFKSSEADALSSAPSSFYNANVDDNESVVSSDHDLISEPTVVTNKNSESSAFDKNSRTSFSDTSKKNYRKYMPNH